MRHDIHIDGQAFGLRPVTLTDAPFMVELRTDPELGRFLNPTSPRIADQEAYLRGYFERADDYYFVVQRLSDRTREGLVAIYDVDAARRCAEWGRWLIRRGSMAALESALLVYRIAFETLGLDWVYCRTVAANERVISFHASCGLETHARLEGYFEHAGERLDSIEQRMTRARWDEVRGALERQAERLAARLDRTARPAAAGGDWRFHHIGVACRHLDREEESFRPLGYAREGTDFTDPAHGIHGRFLTGPGPRYELVTALAGNPVLDPWLERGIRFYHHAYETADSAGAIERLRRARGKLVVPPTPAVAFGGRKAAFVLMPNTTLIEIIEAP